MTFFKRKYKITKYHYLTTGGVQREIDNYCVYKPCKSGAFGDYIDKNQPRYMTLKEALAAMVKHKAGNT